MSLLYRSGRFAQVSTFVSYEESSLSGREAYRERNREVSSGSPMRETRFSGSTSGLWKRGTVWLEQ
jgi:hypothetical protein